MKGYIIFRHEISIPNREFHLIYLDEKKARDECQKLNEIGKDLFTFSIQETLIRVGEE